MRRTECVPHSCLIDCLEVRDCAEPNLVFSKENEHDSILRNPNPSDRPDLDSLVRHPGRGGCPVRVVDDGESGASARPRSRSAIGLRPVGARRRIDRGAPDARAALPSRGAGAERTAAAFQALGWALVHGRRSRRHRRGDSVLPAAGYSFPALFGFDRTGTRSWLGDRAAGLLYGSRPPGPADELRAGRRISGRTTPRPRSVRCDVARGDFRSPLRGGAPGTAAGPPPSVAGAALWRRPIRARLPARCGRSLFGRPLLRPDAGAVRLHPPRGVRRHPLGPPSWAVVEGGSRSRGNRPSAELAGDTFRARRVAETKGGTDGVALADSPFSHLRMDDLVNGSDANGRRTQEQRAGSSARAVRSR